jgi:hypothetical protein
MFQSKITAQTRPNLQKIRLYQADQPLTFNQVFRLWETDPAFRDFYTDILVAAPFQIFRWEMPPFTRDTWSRAYEFVLLDSPYLPDTADPTPFREHFRGQPGGESVVIFPNLGRDAIMIVPTPVGPRRAYPHLASFVRAAPKPQIHALWQRVGETVRQHATRQWTWLNTAGGGVAWLHIRLDSRPKYYRYGPYIKPPDHRSEG